MDLDGRGGSEGSVDGLKSCDQPLAEETAGTWSARRLRFALFLRLVMGAWMPGWDGSAYFDRGAPGRRDLLTPGMSWTERHPLVSQQWRWYDGTDHGKAAGLSRSTVGSPTCEEDGSGMFRMVNDVLWFLQAVGQVG